MHLSDLTYLKFYWDFGMTINLSRYIHLTFLARFSDIFLTLKWLITLLSECQLLLLAKLQIRAGLLRTHPCQNYP